MRYACQDLGEQPEGATVVVNLHGLAANVVLLDPYNFARYRAGRSFGYYGGLCRRSPARLTIPHDGRWHLAVDLGGYSGRVRASVAGIEPPARGRTRRSLAKQR